MKMLLPILLLWTVPLAAGQTAAPDHPAMDPATCPMHAQHMAQHTAHGTAVDQRGDATMGFSHERTTHHFLITEEGGVIQVEANDPADTASRDQIRQHLTAIARQFAAGDFSAPRSIHDRVLPGVPEMIQHKDAISWRYEELEHGGRVVITTSDPAARSAIHDFLKAQIADHRTGDPA
jgi:hypothetical protein